MFFFAIIGSASTAVLLQLPDIAPIGYPAHCAREAAPTEKVTIEFIRSRRGALFRTRVKESTNRCFNQPAKHHVADWGHSVLSGGNDGAMPARGTITLTFNRDRSGHEPDERTLKRIKASLHDIAESLRKKENPHEALERLREISDEYKTVLPASEAIAHSLLAAIAYHDLGQDEKALEVLLDAQNTQKRYGLSASMGSDLSASITELEHMIRTNR